MPRVAKELGTLELKRLKCPEDKTAPVTFAVGGVAGLLIQVTPNQAKSWLLRTTINGKRHTLGLGGFPEVSLAAAREEATAVKARIRAGADPLAEKRERKALQAEEQRRSITFEEAFDQYAETKLIELASEKNRKLWANMVRTYAVPVLGDMRVADITVQDVVRMAEPIWHSKNETARRVSERVANILDWAAAKGYCDGRDLVVWRATFKNALPQVKRQVEHHPALQVSDATRWFATVKDRDSISAKALSLLALTALRSNMLRGAKWDEIDLAAKVWTIPQKRTKMKREPLRVPLSAPALAILETIPCGGTYVFAGPSGKPISDTALSKLMNTIHEQDEKGFTDAKSGKVAKPHGLRSTFRDWAAEHTEFDWAAIEKSLEHLTGSTVERAYQRSDMLEKRRTVMEAWGAYLSGEASTGGNVLPMRRAT